MFQALAQLLGFCCVLAAWWYDGQVHEYTYYIAVAALIGYFYRMPGQVLDMLVYGVTGATSMMGLYKENYEANERRNGKPSTQFGSLLVVVVVTPLVAWFYYSVLTDLLAMRGF